MQLKINGETCLVENANTIAEMLGELKLDPTRTVVEKNGQIVAREQFAATLLAEGDVLELVRFVGGG